MSLLSDGSSVLCSALVPRKAFGKRARELRMTLNCFEKGFVDRPRPMSTVTAEPDGNVLYRAQG